VHDGMARGPVPVWDAVGSAASGSTNVMATKDHHERHSNTS